MDVSKTSNPAGPALFASVRSSRDLSLAGFAVALLAAFALNAGAFLPRLSPVQAPREAPAIEQTTPAAPGAVVASERVPSSGPRG